MSAAPRPIETEELPDLFGHLAAYDDVFLAVSGGLDSTALMHLAAEWRDATNQTTRLHVLTVDHGLRPDAADEARTVAHAAADVDLPVEILSNLSTPPPKTGIQVWARELRYKLLLDHIHKEQAPGRRVALVTAHHRDDLAETVLMRLARGGGVDGLSPMRPKTQRTNIDVLRPLLGVSKARLRVTLEARNETWCEDPSNQNIEFERVRVRNAAALRTDLGLTDAALARTASRMARARSALEDIVSRELRPELDTPLLERCGVFAWPWMAGELPDEICIRLLKRLLPVLGGTDGPLRLTRIERLHEHVQSPSFAGATFARCIITPNGADRVCGARLLIYREANRDPLPEVQTDLGQTLLWDGRFSIRSVNRLSESIRVRPFSRGDLKMFDYEAPEAMLPCPIEALRATPVLEDARGPLYIPALDMHRGSQLGKTKVVDCRFQTANLRGR